MHPIFDARRTIHLYTEQKVEETHIERALQAALLAPCHKFTWPWRFTRVGRATREKLHGVLVGLKFPRGVPVRTAPLLVQKICNPQLLVVSQVRSESAFQTREDYAAIACSIQNFCLSLGADGIGSKWGTGGVTRAPETYRLLGIDPAEEEIVGFVFFGYPAEQRDRPARSSLESVLRAVS